MAKEKNQKDITLNELARMMQREFAELHTDIAGVRGEMVTKHEHAETRETLARAIKDLDLKLTATGALWRQDFASLHSWVKDIDERLMALEQQPKRRVS